MSALELDRDLDEKLSGDRLQLEAFAKEHGLSTYRDLAEILARLVKRGLATQEKERKGRR